LVVLPGMLAGGPLLLLLLDALELAEVPEALAAVLLLLVLLETAAAVDVAASPESALLDPPPQAVSAAARIGRPKTHDEFFKPEAP
jgi:hypothetical protein